MNDRFLPVLEEVDVLVAEVSRLQARGPHFSIVHRLAQTGTICCPGEEIAAVLLTHRGREHCVKLPLAQRILFDFFARHRSLCQSSAQIIVGLHTEPFYAGHASNLRGSRDLRRRFSRSSIKEYVSRIRGALAIAFCEAELPLDPADVLLSEATSGNEITYRLRACVEWVHLS